MITLFENAEGIVTVNANGKLAKNGAEMNDINYIENHSVVCENEIIKDIIPNTSTNKIKADRTIDIRGKIVFPGMVECHTHTVFAGNRADEFRQKLSGVDYEEIAAAGGGILKTVNSVRNMSFEELLELSKEKVEYFIAQGITTLEIKSGYGLSYYDEIKLLQVIQQLNRIFPIDIISTFLGAHTYPPEYKNDHEQYI
ncbi:MAG: imidazolonepropionase, partial [Ignavibacteria bacterium]